MSTSHQPGRRSVAPTISDVASAAGVGRSTAARALGGYGHVKPALRERILEVADSIGYRPNQIAKSMSTGSTATIGMVLADVSNSFFAGVAQGVAVTARDRDHDTILVSTEESLNNERNAVRLLIDKRVDGVILATSAVERDEIGHIEDLQRNGIPVVLVDRASDFVDADTVVIDNRSITRTTVAELVAVGHRRIGFIMPPTLTDTVRTRRDLDNYLATALWTERERLRGYLDAIDDAGIPFDANLILIDSNAEPERTLRYGALLRGEAPATALFCTETTALIRTLSTLGELGLSYPEDVSVVGFDDSPWATIMRPPISMIQQPTFELGSSAAALLLDRIAGGVESGARRITLNARLAARASVQPPRARG